MPRTLEDITKAWGDWKAKQEGTWCRFTESTNYNNQSDLDQYHQYETSATTLSTTFGENRGKLVDALGETVWYDNNTSSAQSNTFTYSETKAESFTWGLSETLKVGVSAKATVGVPLVAEAEVTLSTEIDLTSNQSWTKSNSNTWSDSNPVNIPVKKSVQCQTVMKVQKYDVPFTTQVNLSGCVAIWYHAKVNGHWLWFIPIGSVFSDVIANNLISTDGYRTSGGDVIAEVTGTLTGDLGVSITVNTQEFSLRGWTPTQAEVQEDLMTNLITAAKKQLQQEYPSYAGDSNSLTSSMRGLADGQFLRDYGHTFDSNYRPADCQGLVHLVDQACILYTEADMDKQISDFVSTNLLSAANLPKWMQATCNADATTFIKSLLTGKEDNQCDTAQFTRNYPAQKKDQMAIGCESIIVYANGTLTECAITSTVHALYFAGVFYQAGSPTSAAIGQLEDAAYSSAAALAGVYSITDDSGLQDALSRYGQTKFNAKFQYGYTGTPVDFPSGESQPLLTRNEHLGSFEGRDTSKLDVYVKNEIFTGLNIPIPEAAAAALEDVQTVFKGIFDDTQRGAWNIISLDKMYLLKNVSNVNPVAMNAVIAYWAEDTTAVTQVDGKYTQVPVSLTYIYFMGVVHECKPDSLIEDLFKKFCASIPDNTETDPTGNISILHKELQDYTRKGWKTSFKFDYDTAPPDLKARTPFKTYDLLFEWPHIPSQKEIQDQIDHFWYKKGQTTIFKHCGDAIYDDLVDQISFRAGPNTLKVDFDWLQNPLTTQYTFVGQDQQIHTMEEYALFSFAYGKITEDGHGGDSHEVFALNFLVCVCMVDTVAAADDEL